MTTCLYLLEMPIWLVNNHLMNKEVNLYLEEKRRKKIDRISLPLLMFLPPSVQRIYNLGFTIL